MGNGRCRLSRTVPSKGLSELVDSKGFSEAIREEVRNAVVIFDLLFCFGRFGRILRFKPLPVVRGPGHKGIILRPIRIRNVADCTPSTLAACALRLVQCAIIIVCSNSCVWESTAARVGFVLEGLHAPWTWTPGSTAATAAILFRARAVLCNVSASSAHVFRTGSCLATVTANAVRVFRWHVDWLLTPNDVLFDSEVGSIASTAPLSLAACARILGVCAVAITGSDSVVICRLALVVVIGGSHYT
mmetsp:Transcript_30813/g.57771  ORF Transcript_30813/g.57771 Transcript_30813/m.57771 type:complete len:245 (-) Transcript_30813:675-1409(-)